jgi:uncharacterized protein YcfL
MKKMLLAAMVILLTVVGCASNGDVADLQSQVDLLKTSTAVQIEASTLKAGSMCTAHCAKDEKEMNDKLDSLFKKSMTK